MEFGYFTLSDNHYENNPRDRQPVRPPTSRMRRSIADQLGMPLGLDRRGITFNSLRRAVLPPNLVLAYCRGANQATSGLAPRRHSDAAAQTRSRVGRAMGNALDLLSNGRVDFAAGRGYDGARSTSRSTSSFKEQPEHLSRKAWRLIQKLWGPPRIASRHHGKHLPVRTTCASRRKPIQKPLAGLYRLVSRKPSIELAAPFSATGLIVAAVSPPP